MAAQVCGVEGMGPGLEHTQFLEEVAKRQRLQHQGKGDKQGTPKQMLTQALFPTPGATGSSARGPHSPAQHTDLSKLQWQAGEAAWPNRVPSFGGVL